MPARPEMPTAPTASPALAQLQEMAKEQPAPAVPKGPDLAAEYWAKEGQTPFTSLEKFILGSTHGAATVGSQALSLKDRLMGHVTNAQELPVTRNESEVPQDVQQSPEFKAGDIAGQTGTYAAGSLAGAAGAALSGAAVPAVGAAAAATGAAESAMAGMGGAALESARKGKKAVKKK